MEQRPDFTVMDDGGRWWIHEHAHSYGLNVVRDPALAHRYVVWVQPTWDESSRFEGNAEWGDKNAYVSAARMLYLRLTQPDGDIDRRIKRVTKWLTHVHFATKAPAGLIESIEKGSPPFPPYMEALRSLACAMDLTIPDEPEMTSP